MIVLRYIKKRSFKPFMRWSVNEVLGVPHKCAHMKLINETFSVLVMLDVAYVNADLDPARILAHVAF